jgi:hypothetical protein
MTEAEWLACENTYRMLTVIGATGDGRKPRLFACACVRAVLGRITHPECREVVAVAERLADGMADPEMVPRLDSAARVAA